MAKKTPPAQKPPATANTVVPPVSDAESLRKNILGYFQQKLSTYREMLTSLEEVISDTGTDTQRLRAQQAAEYRSKIIDCQNDINSIKHISA